MSTRSALAAIVWLAVALSVLVWIFRISSAVTFDRPFLGNTSGCEEEALFSVWKAVNGHEVYNNPWLPPFSVSYFGWLFYEAYGWWAKIGLAASGLEDAWLPTFTRFFTLLGLLACVGIFYRLLQVGIGRSVALSPSLLLGLAALVFINPLFHWWAFTTRADVWALAWELAALLAAFYYAQSRRVRAAVLVGVFAFMAWSFRQTNISVLAGFGLWLLVNRHWKVLLTMVASMAVAFGVTIFMLGMTFIDSAFTANALSGDMLRSVAASNALSALTKDPLLALALAGAVILVFFAGRWWHDETSRLVSLVAATSFFLATVFAAKVGASSNYYLPPAALGPLFVLVALTRGGFPSLLVAAFIAAGAAGIGLASASVLSGLSGNLRLPSDDRLHEVRALRSNLREPIFSTDRVANLPWILGKGADSYVYGFAYQRMLEAKPEKFTQGTIAGQLREGKFGTLLLSSVNASYIPSRDELADFRATGSSVMEE